MRKADSKSLTLGAHTRMFKWADKSAPSKLPAPATDVPCPITKRIPANPNPSQTIIPAVVEVSTWPVKVKPRRIKANELDLKIDPVAKEKDSMRIKNSITKQNQSPADKTKDAILRKIFLAGLKEKQRGLEKRREARQSNAQKKKLQCPSPRLRLKVTKPTPSTAATSSTTVRQEIMEPMCADEVTPEPCGVEIVEVDDNETQFDVAEAVDHDPDEDNSVEILTNPATVTTVPESDEESFVEFQSDNQTLLSEDMFADYELDTVFSQDLFPDYNETTPMLLDMDSGIESNTDQVSIGIRQDDDDFEVAKVKTAKVKPKVYESKRKQRGDDDDFQVQKSRTKRKSKTSDSVKTPKVPNDQSREAFTKLSNSAQDLLQRIQVGRFYSKYEDFVKMNNQLKDLYGKSAVQFTCAICAHLGAPIPKFKTEPFHAFNRFNDFQVHYNRNHIQPCICKICGEEFLNLLNLMGHDRKMAAHPTGLHLIAAEQKKFDGESNEGGQ